MSVMSVLKHGTREVGNLGVLNLPPRWKLGEHLLKEVCDQDEEVRRERLALPETTAAPNPLARNTIQDDGRGAVSVDSSDPLAPKEGGTLGC